MESLPRDQVAHSNGRSSYTRKVRNVIVVSLLWSDDMGLISVVWGILAMVWMVLALIPLLGWAN